MLVAAAVYLLTAGIYLLYSNANAGIWLFGIGFPAGITLSFVSVGFSLGDYDKEAMMGVLILPPALWGFVYLMGEFWHRKASNGWGWGICVLGVLCIGRALVGGKK